MVKDTNLRRVGFFTFLSYTLIVLGVGLLGLIVTYFVVCLTDNNDPVSADLTVEPTVEQGSDIKASFTNIVRHRICPYHRFMTVFSGSDRWDSDDIETVPVTKNTGIAPDQTLHQTLPSFMKPGPAMLYITYGYHCPGNIVQSFNPLITVYKAGFTITAKSHEQR